MLSDREQRVCDEIGGRQEELVALAAELIAFDTTARDVGDPPRDEAALQEHLATRLRGAGAEIDLWEPDAAELRGKPLVPPGLEFEGRPQLVARLRGTGGREVKARSRGTTVVIDANSIPARGVAGPVGARHPALLGR